MISRPEDYKRLLSTGYSPCFNLVIEVLLISSCPVPTIHGGIRSALLGFNLAIEVLLISSSTDVSIVVTRIRRRLCFNLVIEVLLVSSISNQTNPIVINAVSHLVIEVLLQGICPICDEYIGLKFQSRNRGSFDFKGAPSEVLRYVLSVVAIPRATHFERRGDHRKIRRIGSKHGS